MTRTLPCPILVIDPRSRESLAVATADEADKLAAALAEDPATADDAMFPRALGLASVDEMLDAVVSLRAWVDAETSAARLQLVNGDTLAIGLILPLPAAAAFSRHDKMAFLGRAVEEAALPPGLCAVFGAAYVVSLCAAGDIARACRAAQRLARRHDHFLLRSAEQAITLRALGKPVPRYLSFYVGGEAAPLRDKFCSRPFTFFEITPGGNAYLCCPSYLPLPIGNAARQPIEMVLNSPRARAIRRSMLDGSFKYCDPSRCKVMHKDRLVDRTPDAVKGFTEVVERVSHLQLSYDPTCNLSCPQCRTAPIAAKGATKQVVDAITDGCVIPMLDRIDTVMLNGYGDVFASKACRKILDAIKPGTFPGLKLDIFTNGVLFTPRQWAAFPGLHGRLRELRISIDAARPETYAVLRRGGNFTTLMENLDFIAELRRQGLVERLQFAFVYQEDNFLEMEAFVELGRRFGCDMVLFEPLMDFGAFSPEEFRRHAIHLPQHPRHAELMVVLARLRPQAPLVALAVGDDDTA